MGDDDIMRFFIQGMKACLLHIPNSLVITTEEELFSFCYIDPPFRARKMHMYKL